MASYGMYSDDPYTSQESSGYHYQYYQSQPLLRYNSFGGSSQASSGPNSPAVNHESYGNQSSPYGDGGYEQDYMASSQPVSPQSYMSAAPASEASSSAGRDWPVFCLFPQCNARPFKRNADLQRHITNTHAPETAKESYPCDYTKCSRRQEPFYRRDHFRDHLRDYHKEDIGKRGGTMDAEWLRDRNLSPNWWRCSKCLVRVSIAANGFECGQCKTRCEKLRKQRRESSSSGSKKSRRRRDF